MTRASGVTNYTNQFTITPLRVASQGLSFTNGVYFSSGSHAGNMSAAGAITQFQIPQSLINGGTGVIYVTTAGAGTTNRAVFQLTGVPGYYLAEGTPESGRLRFDVQIDPRFMNDPSAPTQRMVTAQLITNDGGLSQPATATARFQRVGTGPIQVSLSFDRSDDVDLHVVTPDSVDIYYGGRSHAGGMLDLDSNPACRIDGVNNENTVWAQLAAPPSGHYVIKVDLYQSCTSLPVNYIVKVVNCGVVTTFNGTLNPSQADRGGAGSGLKVTEFDFAPCSGLSVAGRATYDDYVPTPQGLNPVARELPRGQPERSFLS